MFSLSLLEEDLTLFRHWNTELFSRHKTLRLVKSEMDCNLALPVLGYGKERTVQVLPIKEKRVYTLRVVLLYIDES